MGDGKRTAKLSPREFGRKRSHERVKVEENSHQERVRTTSYGAARLDLVLRYRSGAEIKVFEVN